MSGCSFHGRSGFVVGLVIALVVIGLLLVMHQRELRAWNMEKKLRRTTFQRTVSSIKEPISVTFRSERVGKEDLLAAEKASTVMRMLTGKEGKIVEIDSDYVRFPGIHVGRGLCLAGCFVLESFDGKTKLNIAYNVGGIYSYSNYWFRLDPDPCAPTN